MTITSAITTVINSMTPSSSSSRSQECTSTIRLSSLYANSVLLLLLVGCTPITAVQSPDGVVVQAGMTTDQVLEVWGEPSNLVDLTHRRRTLYPTSHIFEYPHAAVYFTNGVVQSVAPKYGCQGRDIPERCY
jgi:hypothetical protein